MKIGICDDNISQCNRLEKKIKEYSEERCIDNSIEIFYSGEAICSYIKNDIKNNKLDLIFLDIELGDMMGMDVARCIRKDLKDYSTEIVFISSHDIYDRELFDFQPLNFLKKEIKEDGVEYCIDLAIERINTKFMAYSYYVSKVEYKEYVKDILYFESSRKKVKIVTENGVDEYYAKISDVCNQLPGEFFVRVSKSFIVNISRIKSVGRENVVLDNGYEISIGRGFRDDLIRHM
ncbi:MAG: LytTR family DNA-binding domain-containing protein [Clostridioides sp.]|nr:LytTR family DNA-binding domain-containing protein [Clostridioides sp.]